MLMLIMSRQLSNLLGASEPMFTIALEQLERASGKPSADVRLTAEIIGKAHLKQREMGLDPRDTTDKELYQGLISLVKRHDEFLVKRLGGSDAGDVQDMLLRIKHGVDDITMPKGVWAIKTSVAKKLLKDTPPKKVMKYLGYRSIDSMLKREPVYELFGAIRILESAEWMSRFIKKYKKLRSSDFESRQVEIIYMDPDKWTDATLEFVRKQRHNITHLKEMGAVYILPIPVKTLPGITITALPLVLHYINELRMYSAYFKTQQVRQDFGDVLVSTLADDPKQHAVMAGQNVHWRVIQRYFGKEENDTHPEVFEPHVQPEDLHWRKAEEVLFRIEPALHFWHDMDYVAIIAGERPISFNLVDVAVNYINKLDYEHRAIYHFRESLWNEIFMRYMGQKTLEHQVLSQLHNEIIKPESVLFNVGREF